MNALPLTLAISGLLVASFVAGSPVTPTTTIGTTPAKATTHLASTTPPSHPVTTQGTTSKPTTHSVITTVTSTKPTSGPTHPLTTSTHTATTPTKPIITPTHAPTTTHKPTTPSIRLDTIQLSVNSVTAYPSEIKEEHLTPNDTVYVDVLLTEWHVNAHNPYGIVQHKIETPHKSLHLDNNGTAHFNLTTPVWAGPFNENHTLGLEAWKDGKTSTYLFVSERIPEWFHRKVVKLPSAPSGIVEFDDTLGLGHPVHGSAQVHVKFGYTKV